MSNTNHEDYFLVHFHSRIYPPHERIGGQESDRTRQKPVHNAGQEAVREEQHAGHEAGNVQFDKIVPDAIGKYPDGGGAANKERLPPPVVVLRAELNISSHNRNLDDCDNQNTANDGQEAKDIIVATFILPYALEYK